MPHNIDFQSAMQMQKPWHEVEKPEPGYSLRDYVKEINCQWDIMSLEAAMIKAQKVSKSLVQDQPDKIVGVLVRGTNVCVVELGGLLPSAFGRGVWTGKSNRFRIHALFQNGNPHPGLKWDRLRFCQLTTAEGRSDYCSLHDLAQTLSVLWWGGETPDQDENEKMIRETKFLSNGFSTPGPSASETWEVKWYDGKKWNRGDFKKLMTIMRDIARHNAE